MARQWEFSSRVSKGGGFPDEPRAFGTHRIPGDRRVPRLYRPCSGRGDDARGVTGAGGERTSRKC